MNDEAMVFFLLEREELRDERDQARAEVVLLRQRLTRAQGPLPPRPYPPYPRRPHQRRRRAVPSEPVWLIRPGELEMIASVLIVAAIAALLTYLIASGGGV